MPIDQINEKGTVSELNGINEEVFNDYPWNRLLQNVDEHYSEHISLAKAACISGLDISSFCAFFRKSVGIKFTDWLRQVRIEKAVKLMKTSDLPTTEIAHEVGFVETITFEQEFEKYTRMTPREFKKSVAPE